MLFRAEHESSTQGLATTSLVVREVRADHSEIRDGVLYGHASVFNEFSKQPGHLERIAPTAFDKVLASEPDVRALMNHSPDLLLGRTTSGTLQLRTDSTGLYFEVQLPDTSYANDLKALVERGDITGASFGFIPDQDQWEIRAGHRIRTHLSIERLVDISVVTFPAYPATDVSIRNNKDQCFAARGRALPTKARLIRAGRTN